MHFDWERFVALAVLVALAGALLCFANMYGEVPPPVLESVDFRKPGRLKPYVYPQGLRNAFKMEAAGSVTNPGAPAILASSTATVSASSGAFAVGGSTTVAAAAAIRRRELRSEDIRIEGILWDPEKPLVSLNGNILPEGGHMSNIAVMRIMPDRVVLWVSGRHVEKKLPSIVLKP